MMKRAVLFLLLSISVIACQEKRKGLVYKDDVNHFEVNYPESWTSKHTVNAMVFLSPKSDSSDNFQENVNIILQDLAGQSVTFDEYVKTSMEQIQSMGDQAKVLSETDIKIAGESGKEFVYMFPYGEMLLKVKQDVLMRNKVIYLMTYAAMPEQYTKFEAQATDLMHSLRFQK